MCEGGEYIETYVVEIRITNRGKQADEVVRFNVNSATTSFQYDGIQPFTTYDIQVFGNLTIEDENLVITLTSIQSIDSPESRMYVCMYVCVCLYVCVYVCMYMYIFIVCVACSNCTCMCTYI